MLSRGPWPRPTILPGHLAYGALRPPRTHSPRVPPGLPASLSHCPPLAVQRPQHSDRVPCYQRMRTPPTLRSRDQITAAHAPQNQNQLWTCQGCTKPPCNLGARPWHHSQMLPGVQAPTGTRRSCRRADHLHHVTREAPRGLRQPKPLERGHPTRRASTGGGGSTPNPPCCSPFGDANGVRNP
jgi:hypothetical protein